MGECIILPSVTRAMGVIHKKSCLVCDKSQTVPSAFLLDGYWLWFSWKGTSYEIYRYKSSEILS